MVRLKLNDFGLFDMQGDVWEWCHDHLGADYYKQSPEQDPRGSAGLFPCLRGFGEVVLASDTRLGRNRSSNRVLRGGSWYYRSRLTRSAFRLWYEAHDRDPLNGFRLVRELD